MNQYGMIRVCVGIYISIGRIFLCQSFKDFKRANLSGHTLFGGDDSHCERLPIFVMSIPIVVMQHDFRNEIELVLTLFELTTK